MWRAYAEEYPRQRFPSGNIPTMRKHRPAAGRLAERGPFVVEPAERVAFLGKFPGRRRKNRGHDAVIARQAIPNNRRWLPIGRDRDGTLRTIRRAGGIRAIGEGTILTAVHDLFGLNGGDSPREQEKPGKEQKSALETIRHTSRLQ